ncbi:MAG: nucleotidyltransferase domain-containing protein [Acidiferrobacter sp.]
MSEKQKDAAAPPAPDRATLVARARRHSLTLRNTCKARLAPLLAQALEAKGIWLFGSVARGEAVEGSDADILVEVGDQFAQDRFLDRMSLASAACHAARLPFACDIIPLSSEEIADKLQSGNLFFEICGLKRIDSYESIRPAEGKRSLV